MTQKSKNPFELRAELLAMAKDYYDSIYRFNKDFADQALAKATELNKATLKDLQAYNPVPYKPEEVIELAKKFYSFVETK